MNGNAKTQLKSLLLPGWGEYSLGKPKQAHEYFIREIVYCYYYYHYYLYILFIMFYGKLVFYSHL